MRRLGLFLVVVVGLATFVKSEKLQFYDEIVNNSVFNDKMADLEILSSDTTVLVIADEMPEFPGGLEKLNKFLGQNLQYPENAQIRGIQGKVYVTFVVERDGSISNAKVAKSIDSELNAEAIRVVKLMPKWNPGKQNGELVRVSSTIPIIFVIKEDILLDDEDVLLDSTPYSMLDKMPEFPGGMENLKEFITQNIKKYEDAQKQDINGTVYVSFIIGTNGNISNIQIIKGVDSELDAEAIRIVKLMPKWKAGELRGKIVPVEFILVLNFGIEKNEVFPDSTVYFWADEMPKFYGGSEKLFDFFYDNLFYPEMAQKQNIKGSVLISFIVETDGSISEVKVIKGAHPELDTEAVRFVTSMPKWKQGKHKNESVRVNYLMPIEFAIAGAQSMIDSDLIFFEVVDTMPEFPGGSEKLMKFIAQNLRYPAKAQEKGIQGKVIVQFVVGIDGNINNVKVLRPVNPYLDAEAVRVIKLMPKWKPGRQDGKLVNVGYTLPIHFR